MRKINIASVAIGVIVSSIFYLGLETHHLNKEATWLPPDPTMMIQTATWLPPDAITNNNNL